MSELLIVIEGNLAGQIRAGKAGRLSLSYESTWRDSPHGYALSVSMPLAEITYPHKAVWPNLWNCQWCEQGGSGDTACVE